VLNKLEISKTLSNSKFTLAEIRKIAMSPALARFRAINLANKNLSDKKALILITSIHIADLLELDLSNNKLTEKFVELFIKFQYMPNLSSLNLRYNKIKSIVIPDLVLKFKSDLNNDPIKGAISRVCNISIYFNGFVWIKLIDAIKEGDVWVDDCEGLEIEAIVSFDYDSPDMLGFQSLVLWKCEDFFIVDGHSHLDIYELFETKREAFELFKAIKSELSK